MLRSEVVAVAHLPERGSSSILRYPAVLDRSPACRMHRAFLLLILVLLALVPFSASAAQARSEVEREVAMASVDSNAGSDSLLCPEMVEVGCLGDRARRLPTVLNATLAAFDCSVVELRSSVSSRERACDDVIQCFRIAGVQLLNFGTAPPGVSTY